MPEHHHHTIANGIIGAASTLLGILTSFQESLEHWLRITSLCVGICVGCVTIYNLMKNREK